METKKCVTLLKGEFREGFHDIQMFLDCPSQSMVKFLQICGHFRGKDCPKWQIDLFTVGLSLWRPNGQKIQRILWTLIFRCIMLFCSQKMHFLSSQTWSGFSSFFNLMNIHIKRQTKTGVDWNSYVICIGICRGPKWPTYEYFFMWHIVDVDEWIFCSPILNVMLWLPNHPQIKIYDIFLQDCSAECVLSSGQ